MDIGFIKSIRNQQVLTCNGFQYTKIKEGKSNQTYYKCRRCTIYKCLAKGIKIGDKFELTASHSLLCSNKAQEQIRSGKSVEATFQRKSAEGRKLLYQRNFHFSSLTKYGRKNKSTSTEFSDSSSSLNKLTTCKTQSLSIPMVNVKSHRIQGQAPLIIRHKNFSLKLRESSLNNNTDQGTSQPMGDCFVEFIPSQKGKSILRYNKYMFHLEKVLPGKIYYKCRNSKCHSRLWYYNNNISLRKEHNHEPDNEEYHRIITRIKLKEAIKKNPSERMDMVYYNIMYERRREVENIWQYPNALPQFNSVRRTMGRMLKLKNSKSH